MAKTENTYYNTGWDKEQLKLSRFADGNAKQYRCIGKQFSYKVSYKILHILIIGPNNCTSWSLF